MVPAKLILDGAGAVIHCVYHSVRCKQRQGAAYRGAVHCFKFRFYLHAAYRAFCRTKCAQHKYPHCRHSHICFFQYSFCFHTRKSKKNGRILQYAHFCCDCYSVRVPASHVRYGRCMWLWPHIFRAAFPTH